MGLDLVVMAAGIGSRYGGLKQLDPVGPSGEGVIDYALYDAVQAGFDRIIFVIRHSIEADFKARFGHGLGRKVAKEYVYQELDAIPAGFSVPPDRAKPWGTAHAVWLCKDAVRGPFGVVNADDFYGRESYQVLAGFLKKADPSKSHYCNVGFELRNTLSEFGSVARGVCEVDSNHLLKSIVERLKIEKDGNAARYLGEDGQSHPVQGDTRVSMNMWGFTPTLFELLGPGMTGFFQKKGKEVKSEYLLPTAVDELMRAGKADVKILESAARWFGVTYREDKPGVVENIMKLVNAGEYPRKVNF